MTQKAITNEAVTDEPVKRKRGRPRKYPEKIKSTEPKKRGRPRKIVENNSENNIAENKKIINKAENNAENKNNDLNIDNKTDIPNEEIAKAVRKHKPHKRPLRSELYKAHNAPGEMSKMILDGMGLMKMPKVDMYNPEAVKERMEEFLMYCVDHDMKPTVEAMALAFGVGRTQMWKWKEGVESNLPEASKNEIKHGYYLMNQLLAQNMADGKINPVAAIFLLKNNHGYRDQSEHIITARQEQTETEENMIERANLLSGDD